MAAEAEPAELLPVQEIDGQIDGRLIHMSTRAEVQPASPEWAEPAEVIELAEKRARELMTKALFRRLKQGDQAAEAELVEAYMPLAAKIALRYRKYDGGPDSVEDLKQVASLGLLQAIRGFDLGRGRAFSSYAYPTIDGVLKRHFRDNTWGVHVERSLQERALLVWRTINSLERQGKDCEVKDAAKVLGISYEEAQEAWSVMMNYRPGSLDEPINPNSDNKTTYVEITPAQNDQDTIIDEVARKIERERILAYATSRNKRIYARYVILGQTQAEVAQAEGISQMQVSRIVRQIKRGHYRLPQKADT